jgi:hypothetical protein
MASLSKLETKMSTTIVIYDTLGENPLRFIVVDRDVSHLNNKYVNTIDISESETDEINEILFYPEGHERAWDYRDGIFHDTFPYHEMHVETTKVITFGFPP